MPRKPKVGDHVAWNTSQGETTGTVVRKLTRKTHVKGHVATASRDDPQYLVKSDKSGNEATHKRSALKPR